MILRYNMSKILAVGIIVLFLGVSVVSSSGYKISDNNKGYIGFSETKSMDTSNEIITIIKGTINGCIQHKRGILWRDIEINTGSPGTYLVIESLLAPSFDIILEYVQYIHAPCFIGWTFPNTPITGHIYGIALGNIEWIEE